MILNKRICRFFLYHTQEWTVGTNSPIVTKRSMFTNMMLMLQIFARFEVFFGLNFAHAIKTSKLASKIESGPSKDVSRNKKNLLFILLIVKYQYQILIKSTTKCHLRLLTPPTFPKMATMKC